MIIFEALKNESKLKSLLLEPIPWQTSWERMLMLALLTLYRFHGERVKG